MSKLFFALFLAVSAIAVSAQSTDDYTKSEFYIGYSNGQVENGSSSAGAVSSFFDDRDTFHGFQASGVYNVSRYVGIKADVSGTYKNRDFGGTFTNPLTGTTTTISGSNNLSLYNVLGGVQIKDNAVDKNVKPFAHAMAGLVHFRTAVKNFTCTPAANCGGLTFTDQTFSDNQVGGAFGGGLDVRMNDRIDLRVISADYNPVWTSDGTAHNFRFGFGIVIK
jgi:hypothetical protein